MATKKIAESMKEKRVLIFNSSSPQIATKLAQMGLDENFRQQGEALYNEVINLSEKQKKENREASLAYDESFEAKTSCTSQFSYNREIIKMASRKDPDLQQRIGINAGKKRSIEDWISQTINFYNQVLDEKELMASLKKYGITTKTLNADKKELESLKTLRDKAMAESGEAQESTRMRNVKMEELEDHCYELKTIATLALKEQPQLLESLGILVRSK